MTNEDRKTVVLSAAAGIVILGDFSAFETQKRGRAEARQISIKALSPGLSILHRVDLVWDYQNEDGAEVRREEQRVSLPIYKELPFSEAMPLIDTAELDILYQMILPDYQLRGFMDSKPYPKRSATFHAVTPLGQAVLPLQFWLGVQGHKQQQRQTVSCDPWPSEAR